MADDARIALAEVRRAIKAAAPDAVESISYGLPTYKYRGRALIYFGAAKNHCALYGTPEGTIRFQPSEPPAETLLATIISARMADIDTKATAKRRKPTTGSPA